MIQNGYGVGMLVIPLGFSLLNREYDFRTALNVLAILIGINTVGFLLHVALCSFAKTESGQGKEENAEETPFVND